MQILGIEKQLVYHSTSLATEKLIAIRVNKNEVLFYKTYD